MRRRRRHSHTSLCNADNKQPCAIACERGRPAKHVFLSVPFSRGYFLRAVGPRLTLLTQTAPGAHYTHIQRPRHLLSFSLSRVRRQQLWFDDPYECRPRPLTPLAQSLPPPSLPLSIRPRPLPRRRAAPPPPSRRPSPVLRRDPEIFGPAIARPSFLERQSILPETSVSSCNPTCGL